MNNKVDKSCFGLHCNPEMFSLEELDEIASDPSGRRDPVSPIEQIRGGSNATYKCVSADSRRKYEFWGEIFDQGDNQNQRQSEIAEASDQYKAVARLIASGRIRIGRSANGQMSTFTNESIHFDPNLNSGELSELKETLLDLKLDTDPKQRKQSMDAVNALVAKLDQAIDVKETEEAPQVITKSLGQLKALQKQVREAITRKEFHKLSGINEALIIKAMELLNAFDRLRQDNPDRMIDMLEQLRAQGADVNPYKTALINFVGSHNTFSFSPAILQGLHYRAQEDSRYDNRRGGRNSFSQALVSAYNQPKKADNPLAFLQKTTRIPEARFQKIIQEALR